MLVRAHPAWLWLLGLPDKARLTCYNNGVVVSLADSIVELSGNMQPDVVTIPVEVRGNGEHRFEVHLAPTAGLRDTFAENNRGNAFVFVERHERVLVLGPTASTDDRPLVEALRQHHVDVDYRPPPPEMIPWM